MLEFTSLFVSVGSLVFVAWWILAPIDRAAKVYQGSGRITVGDVLCLFIAIQLPLAAINHARGEETEFHFYLLTRITCIAAPVIWLTCARSLSRAGVTAAKYRLPFMAIVLPLAYYGLFIFMWAPILLAAMLTDETPLERLPFFVTLTIWLVIATGMVLSGFYTRWIIRRSRLTLTPPAVEPLDVDTGD